MEWFDFVHHLRRMKGIRMQMSNDEQMMAGEILSERQV
jgi:hypothetical protein